MEVEYSLDGDPSVTSTAAASASERVQPPMGQNDEGFWRLEQETLDQLTGEEQFTAQVTPIGTRGVRLDKVHPNDPFTRLGLQEGDIILRVNGRVPGSDLPLGMAMGSPPMGDEATLQLEIERRGVMDLIYYELEP
jgi:type II secretory pathway component PulC